MLAKLFPPPVYLELPAASVEVFRTNVASARQAQAVVRQLETHFPAFRITFDLQDHDRVLRVRSSRPEGAATWAEIERLVRSFGFTIAPLPD